MINSFCCAYNLQNVLLFSDAAMLAKCALLYRKPTATLLQVSMITRWKILYVSDHFSGIHFTSAREKKHPFAMKPVWSETRNRTSDGFTNLILTGGLTGATSYSSPSLLADQYQESGHYAPLKVLRAQSICYYFSSAGCI